MWIVRDKNGLLCLFNIKPTRMERGYWGILRDDALEELTDSLYLAILDETDFGQFKDLTWDDEPVKVSVFKSFDEELKEL